jgi:hypothetical protein
VPEGFRIAVYRHSGVVQDDGGVRAVGGQLCSLVQLVREDLEVEGQPEPGKMREPCQPALVRDQIRAGRVGVTGIRMPP